MNMFELPLITMGRVVSLVNSRRLTYIVVIRFLMALLTIPLCIQSYAQRETIYDNLPPPGTLSSGWLVGTQRRSTFYQSVASTFSTGDMSFSSINISGIFFVSGILDSQYQAGVTFFLYEGSGISSENLVSQSSPILIPMNNLEPQELSWTLSDQTSLKPNTTYWVRASSSNPLGRYAWMKSGPTGTVALSTDDVAWVVEDYGSPHMSVTGIRDPSSMVAPEPSSIRLILLTLLPIAALVYKRSKGTVVSK